MYPRKACSGADSFGNSERAYSKCADDSPRNYGWLLSMSGMYTKWEGNIGLILTLSTSIPDFLSLSSKESFPFNVNTFSWFYVQLKLNY